MPSVPASLRTRIYIDGYNFYYGCLKRTPWKWLDPLRLFEESVVPSILFAPDGTPRSLNLEPLAIKYFTAPILKNFASADDSVSSQVNYHGALSAHLRDRIQITYGYYDAREAKAHRVIPGHPASACEKVEIWKLEEKQSDVNLALHAYSDARNDEIDLAIFVTNDTDIVPALQMLKQHSDVFVGLVVPTRSGDRPVNRDLANNADWVRNHLTEAELASSQLPRVVRKDTGVIHKPLSWYRRPDLVRPALDEAIRVRGGRGAAMKWLGEANSYFDGRAPIELLEDDAGAALVMRYMDEWAAQQRTK